MLVLPFLPSFCSDCRLTFILQPVVTSMGRKMQHLRIIEQKHENNQGPRASLSHGIIPGTTCL